MNGARRRSASHAGDLVISPARPHHGHRRSSLPEALHNAARGLILSHHNNHVTSHACRYISVSSSSTSSDFTELSEDSTPKKPTHILEPDSKEKSTLFDRRHSTQSYKLTINPSEQTIILLSPAPRHQDENIKIIQVSEYDEESFKEQCLEDDVTRNGQYVVENGFSPDTRGEDNGGYVTLESETGSLHEHPSRRKRKKSKTAQGTTLCVESLPMTEKRKTVLFYDKDENEERGNWAGACDFNMSVLGFALGLDNIWRFPYLTYRNGGGTFLFLYLVLMVLVGIPLFLMEASLGQFTSCGVTTCWKFAPLFKGVGISMVVVSALTGVYYNMIVGWTFRYLFASFNSDLPYLHCDNNWNTRDCRLKLPKMVCEDDVKSDDGLCKDLNGKEIGIWNKTLFHEVTGRSLMSPAQEYWEISVLESSASIEIFGSPKWDLVLCLLLAWVICFFCLIKGIKSAGKVVYFTTVCPLILLVILFIRGLTLTHASYGIYFFITPDWSKLGDVTVWKDAINHVLFSLGVASGSLISLSSYNRFHNNIVRDALIISVGDCVTCILGGFVIFSYMGYMAGQQNASIEDVSVDGVGLAFAMYPDAISSLPPPTLWAIFFFLMLVTLGIDSQFVIIETVLTGFVDQFPKMRHKKIPIISSICAISFLLGLPLTCPAGIYLVQLMDNYVSGMTLFIIAAFELVGLMYIYGVNRFCLDITLMTGIRTWIFWKISWCVISPLTIAFIFLYIFIDYEGSTYDDYTYPHWADIMGWMMTVVGVVAIPIVMVYKISIERRRKHVWQKIAFLCKPSRHWGPALRVHRALVTYVEGFIVDPPKKRRKRFVLRRLFAPQTHPDGQDERGAALVAVPIAVVSTVWGTNPNSQQDASNTEQNHLPQDIEAKEESSL